MGFGSKKMTILRVGIVGFGVVGKKRFSCFKDNALTKVVAVADKSLSFGNIDDSIKKYSDFADLINYEKIDILAVCLTTDVAAKAVILGLKTGKHVFCEKPPGRSMDEIKEVINEEKKYPNLKLQYGFNHRHHDSVIEAKKIIDKRLLGKVINLRGVYGKSKLITFGQPSWRTDRNIAGGGVLLDQGIHMVDLIRVFSGEFSEVHSFISNKFWKHNVEDNVYAIMRSKNGIVAMLNSTATSWRHRFELVITLEKGSLILSGILSGSKSYGSEKLNVIYADPDNDNGDPQETSKSFNKDTSWQREINEFINNIKNNLTIENGSSIEAFKTMKLVFDIYNADQNWLKKFNE